MTTPIALTIAGSDSSGGAGIQADLKTFAALGVYGASVITALTAQNTQGVSGIHQVPAEFVTAQIDAVFSDLAVAAVKIGMVAHPPVIDAIVAGLRRWSPKHVVLDPVMVATSGDRLLATEAVDALRTRLIPLASVITPNLPEAAALLDEGVAADEAAVEKQGRRRGGRREHRLSDRFLWCHHTRCAAHRHKKYPRHRLLALLGDCRGAREGRGHGNCRAQCQGLGQRRDRRRRPLQRRARSRPRASFSQVLLTYLSSSLLPCAIAHQAGTTAKSCRSHVAWLSHRAVIRKLRGATLILVGLWVA
jgi:hypothetical protein